MGDVEVSQLPTDAELSQGKRLAQAFIRMVGAEHPQPSKMATMTAIFIIAGGFVKATGPAGAQLDARLRQVVSGISMFARDE